MSEPVKGGETRIPVGVLWTGEGEPHRIAFYQGPVSARTRTEMELLAEFTPEDAGRSYLGTLDFKQGNKVIHCRDVGGCDYGDIYGTAGDGWPCCYCVYNCGPGQVVNGPPKHELVWAGFPQTTAKAADAHGGLAAVQRSDGFEIFWTRGDGGLEGAGPSAGHGNPWPEFSVAPANSAGRSAGITAVSSRDDLVDVFWIAPDGSVHHRAYNNGWAAPQEVEPPGTASTLGGMASVTRGPGQMDIFYIDHAGLVQHRSYDSFWRPREHVRGHNASKASGLAAISLNPNHLEVWWVGQTGLVAGSHYDNGWQARDLDATPGIASPRSGLTAISRAPGLMEVWWIGHDGSIQGANFDNQGWHRYHVEPAANSAALGSGLAAVARDQDMMEVWWVRPDGGVDGSYFRPYPPTWTSYAVTSAGAAAVDTPLAAISRSTNEMELWWIRPDGVVWDAYYL